MLPAACEPKERTKQEAFFERGIGKNSRRVALRRLSPLSVQRNRGVVAPSQGLVVLWYSPTQFVMDIEPAAGATMCSAAFSAVGESTMESKTGFDSSRLEVDCLSVRPAADLSSLLFL